MKRTILALLATATLAHAQQQFTTEERLLIIQNAILAEQAESLAYLEDQARRAELLRYEELRRESRNPLRGYQWNPPAR